jgi:hypothetical protein
MAIKGVILRFMWLKSLFVGVKFHGLSACIEWGRVQVSAAIFQSEASDGGGVAKVVVDSNLRDSFR